MLAKLADWQLGQAGSTGKPPIEYFGNSHLTDYTNRLTNVH